ncbi:MAG: hypothetical protein ACON4N_00920 [Myxococcota bacterium]
MSAQTIPWEEKLYRVIALLFLWAIPLTVAAASPMLLTGLVGGLVAGLFTLGLGFVVAGICGSFLVSGALGLWCAWNVTGHVFHPAMTGDRIMGLAARRFAVTLASVFAGFAIAADIADAADVVDTLETLGTLDDLDAGHEALQAADIPTALGDPHDPTFGLPSEVDGDPRIDHWVEGYYRDDGSYVNGYWRSKRG